MKTERAYQPGDYVAVHDAPVWRDRANFIVRADISDDPSTGQWEQLWVRQLEAHRFEVCCIPFFAYDLALGDEIETDEGYVVRRVTKPSGRCTFRVWFGEVADAAIDRQRLVKDLEQLGCLTEWSSTNLLAVDADRPALAQATADFLVEQERAGRLQYETGRTQ